MNDAGRVAADLLGLAAEVRARAHLVTVNYTALLETEVKAHASEPRTNPRPRGATPEGPRALTGSYRRSIGRRTIKRVHESIGTVGTSDIRGRALELGNPEAFGGTRTTLPYPHFGPALNKVGPKFQAAVTAVAHPGTVARDAWRIR